MMRGLRGATQAAMLLRSGAGTAGRVVPHRGFAALRSSAIGCRVVQERWIANRTPVVLARPAHGDAPQGPDTASPSASQQSKAEVAEAFLEENIRSIGTLSLGAGSLLVLFLPPGTVIPSSALLAAVIASVGGVNLASTPEVRMAAYQSMYFTTGMIIAPVVGFGCMLLGVFGLGGIVAIIDNARSSKQEAAVVAVSAMVLAHLYKPSMFVVGGCLVMLMYSSFDGREVTDSTSDSAKDSAGKSVYNLMNMKVTVTRSKAEEDKKDE